MKKQLFLSLALFACIYTNHTEAAQQKNAGANWGKMISKVFAASGLLYFLNESNNHHSATYESRKINRYNYGLSKAWRLAGVGAFVAAFATDDITKDLSSNLGGTMHSTALLASSYFIAGNKKVVNALRKVPVLNYIFTDPVDEDNEEQTSISAAARYIFTLLVLDGLSKKASTRLFNFDLTPYSLLSYLTKK